MSVFYPNLITPEKQKEVIENELWPLALGIHYAYGLQIHRAVLHSDPSALYMCTKNGNSVVSIFKRLHRGKNGKSQGIMFHVNTYGDIDRSSVSSSIARSSQLKYILRQFNAKDSDWDKELRRQIKITEYSTLTTLGRFVEGRIQKARQSLRSRSFELDSVAVERLVAHWAGVLPEIPAGVTLENIKLANASRLAFEAEHIQQLNLNAELFGAPHYHKWLVQPTDAGFIITPINTEGLYKECCKYMRTGNTSYTNFAHSFLDAPSLLVKELKDCPAEWKNDLWSHLTMMKVYLDANVFCRDYWDSDCLIPRGLTFDFESMGAAVTSDFYMLPRG